MASARRTLTALVIACPTFLLALPATAASARTREQIDVFPGRHALAKALAQAQPGDSLQLHTGTYRDSVTITTPDIVIEAAGDGPVTIDGRCQEFETIEVEADNVTLEGGITVAGGITYEINEVGSRSGIIDGLTMTNTCRSGTFGIDVQIAGALSISSNTMSGFGGGGINLMSITDTGSSQLLIASNQVVGSGRGIIVADSAGGDIHLLDNRLNGNTFSGVYLQNSDGVLVEHNATKNDGSYGIQVDADSDNNVISLNTATGNQFDLGNLGGTGNCFENNRHQTSQGDISC